MYMVKSVAARAATTPAPAPGPRDSSSYWAQTRSRPCSDPHITPLVRRSGIGACPQRTTARIREIRARGCTARQFRPRLLERRGKGTGGWGSRSPRGAVLAGGRSGGRRCGLGSGAATGGRRLAVWSQVEEIERERELWRDREKRGRVGEAVRDGRGFMQKERRVVWWRSWGFRTASFWHGRGQLEIVKAWGSLCLHVCPGFSFIQATNPSMCQTPLISCEARQPCDQQIDCSGKHEEVWCSIPGSWNWTSSQNTSTSRDRNLARRTGWKKFIKFWYTVVAFGGQ
jgi:hypothetical protein